MKRSPMKPGKGLKSTGFAARMPVAKAGPPRKAAPARKATLKTKQRTVTAAEKLLWDRLAALGCVACLKDGYYNPHVSIHHIDGRTKPGCHLLVLPLCAPHHQHDDTDPAGRTGVHPWSARFEARYGSQAELMAMCQELLSATKSKAPASYELVDASIHITLEES